MDLYNTYFDDYAVRTLDKDEDPIPAPFTGIFKPLFSLKRLIRGVDQRRHRAARGGSKGSWSLTVTDRSIGQGDEPKGFIQDFEIILCTREKEGVDMSGFVDFVDALREPQPRPVHSPVNNELMEPIVEANSGPEEPPVEGFAFTSGGFGRFNPLLAPLQQYFKYTEAALLGLFTAQFYYKALSGLIPFPDPGPYDLSDPIPLEIP